MQIKTVLNDLQQNIINVNNGRKSFKILISILKLKI